MVVDGRLPASVSTPTSRSRFIYPRKETYLPAFPMIPFRTVRCSSGVQIVPYGWDLGSRGTTAFPLRYLHDP